MFPLYVLLFAFVLSALYNPHHSDIPSTVSRVLLLTAHPDDECLFFAPTIIALTNNDDLDLYSLTLSVGNADGHGKTRKRELQGSLEVLGIKQSRRWIVDHPQLQDNITLQWNPDIVADVIRPYVLQHQIDAILTFDHEGVSSHPNHKSLPNSAMHLIHSLNSTSSPRLFSLISVPLLTKYTGILSPLLVKLGLFASKEIYPFELALSYLLQIPTTSESGKPNDTAHVIMPVFVSGVRDYWRAVQAMRQHASQLVWFRYLYVAFSRYMWANEWVEVKV